MKFDYMITATGDGVRSDTIKALLEHANLEKVEIQSQVSFDDFLKTLPEAPVPGLANACCDWLQHWGNGGGDYSTEKCAKSACTTDNPRELAQAVYDSIRDYSKTPFEAAALVENIFSDAIGDAPELEPIQEEGSIAGEIVRM